jgi:hypothetical protein
MMPSASKLPSASVGDIVYWLEHGRLDSTPTVAIVQEVRYHQDYPVLEVSCVPRRSAVLINHYNVHHVEAQIPSETRLNYGCWIEKDDHLARQAQKLAADRKRVQDAEKEAKRRRVEREKQLEELKPQIALWRIDDKLDASEIAQKLTLQTRQRWSYEQVQIILREMELLST